jgi:hypothetical protein
LNTSIKGQSQIFSIITIIFDVLIAFLLMLLGVANLISPEVPDSYLEQNTRVCVIFILTGLFAFYAIIRPISGGFLLCAGAITIYFVVSNNPIAYPLLLLGIVSIIRGRFDRRKDLESPAQTSLNDKVKG